MDYAAELALFLTERKASPLATWSGRMTSTEQRARFGRYLGRGRIVIDGDAETVEHIAKRCFGHDYEVTATLAWRDL